MVLASPRARLAPRPRQIAASLGHIVRLGLQHGHGTLGQVLVLLGAGTHLLVGFIEKLAAVGPLAALDDDKVAAVGGLPEDHRAGGQFPIRRVQADLRVRQLELQVLAVTLPQGRLDEPPFGVSNVRDGGHGTARGGL